MVTALKEYLGSLVGLVFPKLCLACRQDEPLQGKEFCLVCQNDLTYVDNCADAKSALIGKSIWPQGLTFFYSLFYFNKDGLVQDMIHQLKYKGQANVGPALGHLLGLNMPEQDWSDYILVPVPLHPKRQHERGYNQATLIAQGVARALSIPVIPNLLIRTIYEVSQTTRSKAERSSVLNRSFVLNDKIAIKFRSKSILLVDDVVTTGSTARACYEALVKGGMGNVAMVTLSVAV